MLTAIAVVLSLVFIGWLIWLAARKKPISAHFMMYMLSTLSGVYALAFFFSMNIEIIIKVLVSIVVGAFLIFLAASQQRKPPDKTEKPPAKT
jgi:4-amino-4-deoxy-L-arabinose transferase-like glycosyltransferase